MKYLFVIIVFLQACKSYKNPSQELKIVEQTPTHILIDGGAYYLRQGVILLDTVDGANIRRWDNRKANYIPNFEQIKNIEKEIKIKYGNHYKEYFRQYYGFVKKSGDTIIETLILRKREIKEFNSYKNWKDHIYEVLINDGQPVKLSVKERRLIKNDLIKHIRHKWKFAHLLHHGLLYELEIKINYSY